MPGQAEVPDFRGALVSGELRVAVGGRTVVEQCAGTVGGAGSAACTPGFNSVSAWLPGPGLSLVVLTNDDASDVLAIARALLADPSGLVTAAGEG